MRERVALEKRRSYLRERVSRARRREPLRAGFRREEASSSVTYIITQPCIDVKDAACVDVCPVDCIYEGPDQYYIHPEECIDCGACVPECPVDAIFPDDEVPDEWLSFIAKNYEHFGVEPPG
jgi:NAD-dependent dihydropyrimidine dehydrogenase PreA subunit